MPYDERGSWHPNPPKELTVKVKMTVKIGTSVSTRETTDRKEVYKWVRDMVAAAESLGMTRLDLNAEMCEEKKK